MSEGEHGVLSWTQPARGRSAEDAAPEDAAPEDAAPRRGAVHLEPSEPAAALHATS